MNEDQASRLLQGTGAAMAAPCLMDRGRSPFTVQAFASRRLWFFIQPITDLGGAIPLRDLLQASFDIVAWKEPS